MVGHPGQGESVGVGHPGQKLGGGGGPDFEKGGQPAAYATPA
jgi:hypothetical protein